MMLIEPHIRIVELRSAYVEGGKLVAKACGFLLKDGEVTVGGKDLDEHAQMRFPMELPDQDRRSAVNHPSHYHKDTGIEVIDAIEAWGLGFSPGNAVKYIARSGHKDPAKQLEDLQKALWYLNRAIANVEQGKAP